MILIPKIPIKVERPSEILSEHDKFKDGGNWFLETARWYVLNYYNTYSSSNSFNQPISQTGIRNSSGNPISTVGNTTSIVDEMIDSLSYFMGTQNNRIFNFLTKGINNNTLPNVMLKGQEIRSLCDHIRGKCLQMINPIEKNISCETISKNTLLKRQEVFDKIDMAAKIAPLLNELGGGIKYQPAGDIDYSNPEAVKEAKDKVRREYENTGTIIGRHAYYKTNLAEKFLSVATDEVIFNLAGIEFKEEHGELVANYVPGYQGIYDYSTWGEYGEGQTLGGYIVPMTLAEALHEYPDMNDEWKNELQDVLYNNVAGSASFMEYYNQPFTNVQWWYNDERWISKAVVYWINECDTRYVEKENRGLKKVYKIDDYKNYYPPGIDASKVPAGTQMKKGYEIPGSSRVWKVHKAVILGNKYLVEYGYDTYQVRPFGDKRKPEIPIKFFCQGKIAGYVRSIVSRLKSKQDELDAVRYRIREYVANDSYGIIINGKKLTENFSALNFINDIRTTHVTVLPTTGDGDADKAGMEDLVKVFSNNAMSAIRSYLELKHDIETEMMDILNIPPAALGEQSGVIGKGVMQNTVSRSEISGLPFFSSLAEYFRRTLQYATNKNKMILLDNEDSNVVLPISNRETKILNLTKEFRYEDLNCFLATDDKMEIDDLNLFRQMMQAYSQQPTVEHAQALLNSLKMMRGKSFGESIMMFEQFVTDQKKRDDEKQMREVALEQQSKAYQNLSDQHDQAQAEVAKLTGELAKLNLKGSWDLKKMEAQKGIDTEAKLSDAYIEQITGLIQQQMAAMNQPAQGQPPQGQPQPSAPPAPATP